MRFLYFPFLFIFYIYTCIKTFLGGEAADGPGLQVSRHVRYLHHQDLLDAAPVLPGSRQRHQGPLWRRFPRQPRYVRGLVPSHVNVMSYFYVLVPLDVYVMPSVFFALAVCYWFWVVIINPVHSWSVFVLLRQRFMPFLFDSVVVY